MNDHRVISPPLISGAGNSNNNRYHFSNLDPSLVSEKLSAQIINILSPETVNSSAIKVMTSLLLLLLMMLLLWCLSLLPSVRADKNVEVIVHFTVVEKVSKSMLAEVSDN